MPAGTAEPQVMQAMTMYGKKNKNSAEEENV